MHYFKRPISAREFFEEYKKYVESLEVNGKLTQEQIQQYKENFFALEVLSEKYDTQRRNYREFYSFDEKVEDIAWLLPSMEEILQDFYNNADRSIHLDKMNVKALSLVARLCKEQIDQIKDFSNLDKNCNMTQFVGIAVDNIVQIHANDKQGDYAEDENHQIPVEKIIYNYPDSVKVVKDLVTQKVFKNQLERNELACYQNVGSEVSVILRFQPQEEPDRIQFEKDFSYYDWAVMEAITSLYLAGNEVIDLQSIDKVLKHNKKSRNTKSKSEQMEKSLLFDSLKRLCNNYIQITAKGTSREGFLINGDFHIADGKIYLHVKNIPVLYDYADSINHVLTVKNEELQMNLSYTEETISIYRYLMERVLEIFGTLKTEDLMNGKQRLLPKSVNKILSSKICEAILFDDVKDRASKERRIRERTEKVLEEMKLKGFFSDYEIIGKGSSTYYELKRLPCNK